MGSGTSPVWLGLQVVEMRGSSKVVCQKLMQERGQHPPGLKREGKIPCGDACLQLRELPVVFQGEMGAPGVQGDKGEKVVIVFSWSEPLRPGEGSGFGKGEAAGDVLMEITFRCMGDCAHINWDCHNSTFIHEPGCMFLFLPLQQMEKARRFS